MSESRTRTRDEVLVDEVRESPVDLYLGRFRRRAAVIVLLVVVAIVLLVVFA
ncbi:MAG TPA: hypothetical protein VKU40_14680 [Thermoanaerobaculia bacterium]|nr:hypothetical protein [Thermoanaerobaculia bacterium]